MGQKIRGKRGWGGTERRGSGGGQKMWVKDTGRRRQDKDEGRRMWAR